MGVGHYLKRKGVNMVKKDYEKDAQYFLKLALSFIMDMEQYAQASYEELAKKKEQLAEDIGGIRTTTLLGRVFIGAKKRGLHREIKKELKLIFEQLDKADKLDDNAVLKIEEEAGEKVERTSTSLRAIAWYMGGRCFLASEKTKEALEAFEKSFSLVPSQESLEMYAATLAVRGGMGSKQKILEAWQRVVDFDPYSAIGLEAAKRIARMQ